MKTVKFLYVYILKCSDSSYYTGVTNNPEKRLLQHNKGIKQDASPILDDLWSWFIANCLLIFI